MREAIPSRWRAVPSLGLSVSGGRTPPRRLFFPLALPESQSRTPTDATQWFDEPCPPSRNHDSVGASHSGRPEKGHNYVVTQTLEQKVVCVTQNPERGKRVSKHEPLEPNCCCIPKGKLILRPTKTPNLATTRPNGTRGSVYTDGHRIDSFVSS